MRKFLEGTDAHIGESRFNTVWAEALGAFFHDDYRAAAAKLTEVNTILLNLPDVKRILSEAQEKVRHPPPRRRRSGTRHPGRSRGRGRPWVSPS